MDAAARSLKRQGLVKTYQGAGGPRGGHFEAVLEGANERVGLWPTPETATDRLLTLLTAAIEKATPEERSRLQKLRDLLLDDGRALGLAVTTAALTGQWG